MSNISQGQQLTSSEESFVVNGPAALQYKLYLSVGTANADYITDGVADDVQINQAITAANASGGGVVFLKDGTFNTVAQIVTKSNVMIMGMGMGNTIVKGANAVYNLIGTVRIGTTVTLNNNISVRDISFESQHDSILQISNTSQVSILNCEFYYSGITTPVSESFVINYCNDVLVQGNYLRNLTGNGIQINATSYFSVIGNVINGVVDLDTDGIDIDVDFLYTSSIISSYGTITGNTIRNCVNGMRLENGTDFAVSGNNVYGSSDTGIYCNTSNGLSLLNVTISGNTIDNCVNNGIAVVGGSSDVKGVVIIGNAITNCGQVGGVNIRSGIQVAAANVSVVGNYLVSCGGNDADGGGIVLYKQNNVFVQGNTIQASTYGIRVWNGSGMVTYTGVMLLNNMMIGSVSADYVDAITQPGVVIMSNNANGIGIRQAAPTAQMHLGAGTASASASPLKFTTGTNLTTAEAGAVEYDGVQMYFTPSGTSRRSIATYLSGRATAQVAAVASVLALTVGATDATFQVSANVNVTAAVTASFTCTCTYTDETNTSRTLTLNFSNISGTLLTTITNVTGTGAYEGLPVHIRCKASTVMTIATTGTFTSVTYNVEGSITQIA